MRSRSTRQRVLNARAVVLHLLRVPAAADAEEEAAVREVIEARHFLRRRDGIALDHEADAGAELELRRDRRRHRERDERIVAVPVLLRQGAAAGPRAAAARRDVRVLGHPQRLEAALLDGAREIVGADRVVRGEHDDAVVHGEPPLLHRNPSCQRRVRWRAMTRPIARRALAARSRASPSSITARSAPVPTEVLRHQAALRAEMEAEPVRFLVARARRPPRRRARGARRVPRRRSRRPRVRDERDERRQRRAALARPSRPATSCSRPTTRTTRARTRWTFVARSVPARAWSSRPCPFPVDLARRGGRRPCWRT